MPIKPARTQKRIADGRALKFLYLLGFLFYLQSYLPLYINSSFLNQFISDETIGLIYTIGAAISIALFLSIPWLIKKAGLFKTASFFGLLHLLSIFFLAFGANPAWLIIVFVGGLIFYRIVAYGIDILVEEHSSDSETGGIRGVFLTTTNIALIISPLVSGFIVGNENSYQRIYTVSFFIFALFLVLLLRVLRNSRPLPPSPSFKKSILKVRGSMSIRAILMANLLLRFFYAWMVIYTPIYLHEYIGFGWEKIGVIFTIMLLPFVLLEIPLGKLADKKLGEKEILSVGFVWVALTAGLISFVSTPSFVLWAGLLFLTRVGASAVEIMTETYFFKKIDESDADLLGFFRMVQPAAYVIAPVIASVILLFVDFRWLFLILGFICLYGIRWSLAIKDTL